MTGVISNQMKTWRVAMKVNQRKLLMVQCPNCSHEFPDPLTLFDLPADIELLVACLTLPAETVTAMLDRREIPIRQNVDKNRHPTGRRVVLLGDARELSRTYERIFS